MKRVVIIGGGFGGLNAARLLADKKDLKVTLIDRTNHHLFQPLLYQVATAALSPGDIAVPIRGVFRKNSNILTVMGDVKSIDKDRREVLTADQVYPYDYLIVATGARHSYFGKDEWEKYAPGLKTVSDALTVREKILCSLEQAEKINDSLQREKYLNFVIVGGGPTGVEMAGAIAEIAKRTIIRDFKNFNASHTTVYLVEALPRILTMYDEKLAEHAVEDLKKLGVEVLLKKMVTGVDENGVTMGDDFIPSVNIIWAAGNQVSNLIRTLNTETDKAGRAVVSPDLTINGYDNIFVIGDAANYKNADGTVLPAIAPVAIQQGKYAAKVIREKIPPSERAPFKYSDRGNMATIGRAKAVAEIKGLKLTGFIAWLAWSLVHVLFLIGFRNRFRVMAEWIWYYITFRQGIRLIVDK
jgi:NADH:ubiquinone reductase (H+-translocating)